MALRLNLYLGGHIQIRLQTKFQTLFLDAILERDQRAHVTCWILPSIHRFKSMFLKISKNHMWMLTIVLYDYRDLFTNGHMVFLQRRWECIRRSEQSSGIKLEVNEDLKFIRMLIGRPSWVGAWGQGRLLCLALPLDERHRTKCHTIL